MKLIELRGKLARLPLKGEVFLCFDGDTIVLQTVYKGKVIDIHNFKNHEIYIHESCTLSLKDLNKLNKPMKPNKRLKNAFKRLKELNIEGD
jgi:hypothetical protein